MSKELGEGPRKIYSLFAEILEYPSDSIYECFDECISLLLGWDGEAAGLLKEFEFTLARLSLPKVQEIYTRTFDLQPACHPYVGHHLFGEDYRRGLFMAGLKREYEARGFSAARELPDHLAVMLRFWAEKSGVQEGEELFRECIIPALDKMLAGGSKEGNNPYRGILRALFSMLQKGARSGKQSAELPLPPSRYPNGENPAPV